jgi:hypothetical protein
MKNRIPIEELIKAEAQVIGETTPGNNQGSGSFKWTPIVITLLVIAGSMFFAYKINRGTQIKYRLNGKENEGRDSN